jgi:cytoskeletal protein RodZ
MSDDTPTQRFDVPEGGGEVEEKKKNRALMIALIILGAVLLIAIIILVVVLAARGSGSPQADTTTSASQSSTPSDTPSVTPSATPTATTAPTPTTTAAPPPPSNDAKINSFKSGSTSVLCNESAPQGDHQPIGFTWSTSKAAKVYFGVDTTDASTASLFDNLPASGNSNDDFPDGYNHGTYEYPCTALKTTFTLTVVGDNGSKQSKTVTIINKGDH